MHQRLMIWGARGPNAPTTWMVGCGAQAGSGVKVKGGALDLIAHGGGRYGRQISMVAVKGIVDYLQQHGTMGGAVDHHAFGGRSAIRRADGRRFGTRGDGKSGQVGDRADEIGHGEILCPPTSRGRTERVRAHPTAIRLIARICSARRLIETARVSPCYGRAKIGNSGHLLSVKNSVPPPQDARRKCGCPKLRS